MGLSVFPAPSAGKTRYVVSLTSGTSWTVPTGVTYVNAKLIGAGGGAGGNTNARGGDGGTTTFTGATSAVGGMGGPTTSSSFQYAGADGKNYGAGGTGSGSQGGQNGAAMPSDGAEITTTVTTTPGASITYGIGAGGVPGGSGTSAGGYGANGKIEIEYWV